MTAVERFADWLLAAPRDRDDIIDGLRDWPEARAGALDVEALDVALVGMVRTSWPMDRNAEEKGWNEAIHAARKKVRAILTERETLAQQLNHAISESIATTPPRKKRKHGDMLIDESDEEIW